MVRADPFNHEQILLTSVPGLRELILHVPNGYGLMVMSWGTLALEFVFPLAVMLMAWRGRLPSIGTSAHVQPSLKGTNLH